MGVKAAIKCSEFAIGQVRSFRGLVADLTRLFSFIRRKRQINAYFKANRVRKVQLGASGSPLVGWLNTDLLPTSPSVVYLDASKHFPFPDDSIDYIEAEHMIEHIDYLAGQSMLRQCYRVLRPGGRVRMSTPDLSVILGLHANPKSPKQEWFIRARAASPDLSPLLSLHTSPGLSIQDVFIINQSFHGWGHQFLYDQDTLKAAFMNVGFQRVSFYKSGESDDAHLQDIETHGRFGGEEMNSFETTVIEAQK